MSSTRGARLGYLDWARGLCVLFMIHTHAFYAWVRPADRDTAYFSLTRLMGGFPGAVFLLLSGMVLALANEARWERGESAGAAVRHGLARGLEILGYAFLFRLWMWLSSNFARPEDLLRVDILNCIGASLTLAALTFGLASWRSRLLSALALAAAIVSMTPLTWDSSLKEHLPYALAAYLDGRLPDSFFPVFPWGGFTMLGAAAGILLHRARRADREPAFIAATAVLAVALVPLAGILEPVFASIYPRYDYWHTSPAYFLIKTAVVLFVTVVAYVWNRLPGWSPLRQMGRTSLLVYWVHIEVIYGKYLTPWARDQLDLLQATTGVLLLTLAMLGLSLLRTHLSRGSSNIRTTESTEVADLGNTPASASSAPPLRPLR